MCICVHFVNLGFVGLEAPTFVYLRCQRDGPARERHTRPCGRLVAHIMFNVIDAYDTNNIKHIRVTKRTARRVHAEGREVVVVACNVCPFTMWHLEAYMEPETDFDMFVNAFEAYNCNNELGRYASYYVAQ